MKKVVYHLAQGNSTAEVHLVLAKGKIQDYYVKSSNENLKFSIEEILERTLFYSVSKKFPKIDIQVFVGLEEKFEEALFILPQIFVWHGFKIEKVERISDRTLKSFSILENPMEEGEEVKEVVKAIEEILFKFEERSKDVILLATTKSINYAQFANDKGVVEKVPAGYIAYNVEDGRVLSGGKFLGVKVETLEEGKPWILIPANKKPAEALAKLRGNKAEREDVSTLLSATLSELKLEEGKIDELLEKSKYFKGLNEEKKKLLKDLLLATGTSEAKKYVQTQQKVSQPSNSPGLNEVYVYDPVNGYLTNASTYLANRSAFSGKEVFFTDNILKLRKLGAEDENIFFELLQRLGIRWDDKERVDALAHLLADIIQNPKTLNKRGPSAIDLMELRGVIGPKETIPAGILDIPTGSIIKLDENTAKLFGLPLSDKEGLDKRNYTEIPRATIEAAAKLLSRDYSARIFERGKPTDITYVGDKPEIAEKMFPEEERKYHKRLLNLFTENGKFKENLDDIWKLLGVVKGKDSKGKDVLILPSEKGKEIIPLPTGNFGEKFPLKWFPKLLEAFGIIGYNSKNGPIRYEERIKLSNTVSLQPYQVQALLKFLNPQFLRHTSRLEDIQKVGMFIAHATGLGKTFTGLLSYALATNLGLHSVSYTNKQEKKITFNERPALAIMPETIAKGWIDDASTLFGWKVGQEIFVIEGNPKQRREKWAQLLDLWARANSGEQVKLPRMVIMKLSTFQKMDSVSAEDETDKYYLNLLSGPSIISHKGSKLSVPFGMFGMMLVDEASTIFSKSSARRRHIEDISNSITSDANKGYTLLLNATSMSNSPKDFSSVMEMLFYNGHLFNRIFGDAVIKDATGRVGINEELLRSTATYIDTVGPAELNLRDLELEIHQDQPLTWPTEPVDTNKLNSNEPEVREPEIAKEKFEEMFLKTAALIYQLAKSYKKKETYDTTVYSAQGAKRTSVPAEVFYEMYVPGFATLFSLVQGGAFTWERALEYGFVDFDDTGPFIIAEENKPKAVSAQEVAIYSIIDTLSNINPSILERLGKESIFKALIPKLKEYKTAEGKKKEDLRKELFKIATTVPLANGLTFAEMLSMGLERTLTHGLGAGEIKLSVNVPVNRGGKKTFNKSFKIRFPGFAWNKKVNKETEQEGTLKRRSAVSGALGSKKQKTGSERKISIETRNKMLHYMFFLTPTLSDEKHLYYPVIVNTDLGEFKIYLAKRDIATGSTEIVNRNDKKAAPFLNEDGTINEDFAIKQEGGEDISLSTIGENIGKRMEEASLASIALTLPFRKVFEEAIKPFKPGSNLGRKVIITSPSTSFVKAIDFVIKQLEENTPIAKALKKHFPELSNPSLVRTIKQAYKGSIIGDVPVPERLKIIEDHNSSNGASLTLLSRAASRGVNMPSQRIVVHGSTFSYETIVQMLGRAFRPGGSQKGKVDASIVLPQVTSSVLGLKSFEETKIFDMRKLLTEEVPLLSADEEDEYETLTFERETAFAEKVADALSNIIGHNATIRIE